MTEATALTPQQSFQQKLMDRIRDDIGELMPDEALSEIVGKAIEKSFFEERETKDGYYGHHRTEIPWLVKLTRDELNLRVHAAVTKWFGENDEKVRAMVQERFDEGIVACSVRAINGMFQGPMMNLQAKIDDRLQKLSV